MIFPEHGIKNRWIKKFAYLSRYTSVMFIHSLLLSCASLPLYTQPSTAFFYGRPVPVDLLSHFDRVVVEPENMDNLRELSAQGVKVFAYISIGEINPTRTWYSEIPQSWLMGHNEEWGSSIVDLTQQGWHDYLIDQYLTRLWEEGYRGFFLDTLDSYQRTTEPHDRRMQESALSQLIKRIHENFPGVELIFNRGFEILPEVGRYAVALAAESLFQRWDQSMQSYTEVPEADRVWLLEKLWQVKDQYGLQIIVIDYVDPKQRKLTRKTAERISELGFTPWVANPELDMLDMLGRSSESRFFLGRFSPFYVENISKYCRGKDA